MDGRTDGQTDGWMGRWTDGQTDGWMDGQTQGWMNGWVDGLMTDGWLDGWMAEYTLIIMTYLITDYPYSNSGSATYCVSGWENLHVLWFSHL